MSNKQLTKKEKAIDLFFNHNLTTSIIAEKLGVSQNWVCKIINN